MPESYRHVLQRAFRKGRFLAALGLLAAALMPAFGQVKKAAATADSLGRTSPRSTVTAFLQACDRGDYQKATEYLDLRKLAAQRRAERGRELAQELEAILNSDTRFDVLRLSQDAQGDLSDDPNPALEHVTTIISNDQSFPIELERVELQPGNPVWLFSSNTVAEIPDITPSTTNSAIEARLPRLLVSIRFLDTPLWKWLALLILAVLVFASFRLTGHLILRVSQKVGTRFKRPHRLGWLEAVLHPFLVLLSVLLFGLAEEFVGPSALSRLYIGRFLLLIVTWSIAWCLINVIEVALTRVDSLLDPRQRMVSHSLLYLARRVTRVIVVIVAAIVVLSNWGYDMTTIIAGLGVGGIAFALAAQKTIENVFGGVSVIGDNPVMVGDFGKFGDLVGTVEDIGMRSTRIRTLNRTVVSVPNAAFATMNLENYSLRDKLLFNPTIQIKRPAPKEKVHGCMAALSQMLSRNTALELSSTPVRLTGFTAASYAVEIFAYAKTNDMNEFYRLEADLFLSIDEVVACSGVELA